MRGVKTLLFLLFWFCQSISCFAFKMETFNFGYGANQYTSILQDKNGLIWLGSNRGLFFYDGYEAHPFQLGTYVYSIVQTDNDRLCFTDEKGAHLIQLSSEQILSTALSSIDLGQVRACYSQGDNLWIGSERQGLVRYNLIDDTYEIIQRNIGECYSLEYASDRIYIGGEKGLAYYDLQQKRYVPIELPIYRTSDLVNSLLWDAKRNSLWIGTIGTLYSYHPDKEEFSKVNVKPTSYKCMAFDVEGRLMIGTDNGLIEYQPETDIISYHEHDVRYQHSLSSNIIWGIYRDKGNNIWMGTDHGVSLLHYSPYHQYVPILYLTASASLPTNEGNHFTCITKDSDGNYWYGGTNGVIFDPKVGEKIWFRNGSSKYPLPHNRIRRIYEDKEKEIWLATDEGILRYDKARRQFISYTIADTNGNLSAQWVYDIYEDTKGRLWVATYGGGLFVMDKKALIASKGQVFVSPTIGEIAQSGKQIPNHVYYLLEDKRGNLWIGHKEGLAFADMETMRVEPITLLNEKGDAAPIYINNLTMGEDGNLWYTVKDVLCKINMTTREVDVLQVPGLENEIIQTMTYRDGSLWMALVNKTILFDTRSLICKELRLPDYSYQALYYDKEESVFIFGGNDGLLYVQPEICSISDMPHGVHVVSILSNNERLRPLVDYQRKSYDNKTYDSFAPSVLQLTFEISDYSYAEPSTLSYQYQLEGYDNKWTSLSPGNNRIVFLNLSPGRYTLNTRNGVDEATTSSYHFEIRPPWYMTTWAYIIYIIMVLLVLSVILKYLFDKNRQKYERLERERSLELSNMKIDFFTNISHELKTPLSLIIAPLSKIINETSHSTIGNQLQVVHQNAQRLNTLIQQILDFKRMEYKKDETLVRSRTDINRLLTIVSGSFKQVADTRNITIETDIPAVPIWMNVDVFKIESILYNVLSNAVKFVSDDTGHITIGVKLEEEKERVCITVKDNGVGIPEDELKLIWLRMYQGGNKQLNSHGTGIGLYLVKRFVNLHDGSVEIESQANIGTTIHIMLPLKGENLIVNSAINKGESTEQSVIKKIDSRPSLLIIDDNEEILSFLMSAFSANYQCMQACNVKEGLDMALKMHPDVIIVDEMMPVMTGMEFCTQLRKAKQIASTPVIMLTAKDDSDTELNSMKAGVDVFVPKPFDLNRLTLRIVQLLESRKQLQEKIHLEQMIDTTVDIKEELLNDDERLMKHVLQVIEDRMSDSAFNVSQLCEDTGIGSKRLLRMLKKQTGQTPVNFIRQIRLKKAALLLQQKKFTVTEVMYMIGFSHPSYFTRSFTEEFGISPKEYLEREHK